MTAYPTLYSFRRCPYAIRARLALLISGTICEIREVKLSAKPAAMIEASAKATVPVLVASAGNILEESLDIMHWALGRSDPQGWLQRSDQALIDGNDGPFKHHLDRYKYPQRYENCDPDGHRASAMEILQMLDTRLAGQDNLAGMERGLADMAIMPFVRQFAAVDREWFARQKLPHLQKWLARHLDSQLFKSAMIKLKPWQEGDDPILFPDANLPD